MATIPAPVDYTNLDFASLRARLYALYESAFPDRELDSDEVALLDAVMLECFAWVGDVLVYKLDANVRESFLAWLTQRRSALALSRQYGYVPRTPGAATVDVTFTLAASPAQDVTIPAGTVVRTKAVASPVRFQTLEEVVIAAAADPPEATVTVEQSTSHSEAVTANGARDFQHRLRYAPYLADSLAVVAGNGAYTVVDSMVESDPSDRHLKVIVDEQDRATLQFGDGVVGAPPQGTVAISYKTGGGAVGNVEAGAIQVIEATIKDAGGVTQSVTVTQPLKASGGGPRESLESIRRNAPASLRALTRSVAREDFEINARRIAGVARARMLTSNEDPGIDENAGILLIVPEGGGAPSQALKDEVEALIVDDYPPPLTFQLSVQDPVYRAIDVSARVKLQAGVDASLVRAAIIARLEAFFLIVDSNGLPNPLVEFGGGVVWSDIFNQIRDTAGVRSIGPQDLTVGGLLGDVSLAPREFPVLGEVELINAATGNAL